MRLLIAFFFCLISLSAVGQCISGDCEDGYGTYTWTTGNNKGDKYVGEFKNYQIHGKGTYTWTNGDSAGKKYVGEWKYGKLHGQGTYTTTNGYKYVGEYKNGKRHGQGIDSLADGRIYRGEHQDGSWHGQAVLIHTNGDMHVGEWIQGQFEGDYLNKSCIPENLTECIKDYVEQKIKKWQEKGEFEKTKSYKKRVNNDTRNKKIIFFQNKAIEVYKNLPKEIFRASKQNINFATLKDYDADNETFLIDFTDFGTIILEVPIDEAPEFKSNFKSMNFELIDVVFTDNNYVIAHIIYNDVSNTYRYLLSKDYEYITTEIDYDFNEIDLSFNETLNTDNIVTGTKTINHTSFTKDITFQSSDSTFYISSIAVIPKEIKACDGSVSSADELASYTETNILSHYNVTDRRHLEAILEEHRLQMSGLTLEKTLLESGCIENAQAYLFVREGCLKGDEIIELRLVHCETSTLVWSCVGKNASIDEILDRINEELSKD